MISKFSSFVMKSLDVKLLQFEVTNIIVRLASTQLISHILCIIILSGSIKYYCLFGCINRDIQLTTYFII